MYDGVYNSLFHPTYNTYTYDNAKYESENTYLEREMDMLQMNRRITKYHLPVQLQQLTYIDFEINKLPTLLFIQEKRTPHSPTNYLNPVKMMEK